MTIPRNRVRDGGLTSNPTDPTANYGPTSRAASSPQFNADWRHFRAVMPITHQWAYLDHAAVAPLPEPTRQAMQMWLSEATEQGDTLWPRWAATLESLRQSAAELIAARTEEIALIPNTTAGISLVAEGFPWRHGDNIVTLTNEFPSNLYPWINLAQRGVELRRVPVVDGQVDYQALADACDARTRIVSASWIGYATGYRLNVARVSQISHARKALFFLDAIQGLGVFPLDVRADGVDFLAADGHKWLLGPEGAGIFFARQEHLALLHPIGVGWNSVVRRYDFSHINLELRPTAARYEGGSMNMIGFHGLAASLTLLRQFGVCPTASPIAAQVLDITNVACEALRSIGAHIMSPRDVDCSSGIVLFKLPNQDPEHLRNRCRDGGVVVSCRGGGVRVSMHAYNDQSDIDRLIDCIKSA